MYSKINKKVSNYHFGALIVEYSIPILFQIEKFVLPAIKPTFVLSVKFVNGAIQKISYQKKSLKSILKVNKVK